MRNIRRGILIDGKWAERRLRGEANRDRCGSIWSGKAGRDGKSRCVDGRKL